MRINKAEAFYTGGGIYIAGIYTSETEYCTIDNDFGEYLNFFSTDGEDKQDFACQNLTDSKHLDILTDGERRIYIRLLKALHKAMMNGAYEEDD